MVGRVLLALGSVAAAFILGIETAGEFPLHDQSQAALSLNAQVLTNDPGDIDEIGIVNIRDVFGILEVSQNLRTATREEILRADVDKDGSLTVKDALRILHSLADQ